MLKQSKITKYNNLTPKSRKGERKMKKKELKKLVKEIQEKKNATPIYSLHVALYTDCDELITYWDRNMCWLDVNEAEFEMDKMIYKMCLQLKNNCYAEVSLFEAIITPEEVEWIDWEFCDKEYVEEIIFQRRFEYTGFYMSTEFYDVDNFDEDSFEEFLEEIEEELV